MFFARVHSARMVIVCLLAILICGLVLPVGLVQAAVTLEVTPITWNVVGLDSNNVNIGPNHFPVGARVCNRGDEIAYDVTSGFTWQTSDPYINLRTGTQTAYPALGLNLNPGQCTDFYYEVEVTRSANAYNHARRYRITASARTDSGVVVNGSTPAPREIFVEHLVSQARNAVTDVRLNGVSIAAGGTMSLVVGQTYTIQLVGQTATGYNQLESFINFPNTIFQILSVNSTYTTVDPPAPSSINRLYSDACAWEPDPTSLNYRSCTGVGKTGGQVTVTYQVRILQVGTINPEPLNTLFYDFSGSSYHYNSDYSINVRFGSIIDPSTITVAKNFAPDPTNAGGASSLTFTITNPTPSTINGVSFTDTFPTSPGAMMVAASPNASTSNCGSPAFTPVAGAASISFSGGTLAPNSTCTVRLSVSVPAVGTYTNTSSTLRFVDGTNTIDTGNTATDTLGVNNAPPAPSPICGLLLAQWVFPSTIVPGSPAPSTANVTASAASGSGLTPIYSPQNNTTVPAGTGSWGSNGAFDNLPIDTNSGDYLQFALDTTNYTSVELSFDARRTNNGPQGMAVYSNTSTTRPGTLAANLTGASGLTAKDTWYSYAGSGSGTDPDTARNAIIFSSLNSSGLTYFNIYGTSAGNASPGSDLYLDNVTFYGCAIPKPAALSKSFTPSSVPVNSTSALTFTLTNPNTIALTGASFNDTLPAGLEVANPTGASTTCTGATFAPAAGATSLTISGGTIPAGGSCTVSVTILATTSGPHNNISGFLTTTQAGTNTGANGSASANLTALLPPDISKFFSPAPVVAGSNSVLTFLVTNPNQNDTLNGIAFTDTYPATLVNAASPAAGNTCGGTVTATAGVNSISLTGGSLAGGASCRVSVTITAPAAGTFDNTSGAVSSTNGGTGNTASASLLVSPPNPSIAFLKQVSTTASGPWSSYLSVVPGTPVYYRFVVENTGDVPLTGVSLTDPNVNTAVCTWPSPLPVGTLLVDPTATCVVGPVSALAGDNPNTATVNSNQTAVPVSDSALYTGAQPALSLVKEISEDASGPWSTEISGVAPGGSIYYRFTVINTGNVELNTITISDPQISTATCAFTNPLPASGVTTCVVGPVTAQTIIGTYDNTATAHGVYRYDGLTYDSAPSTARYALDAPNLIVTKTNDTADAGILSIPFTWTLTVANTGTNQALFTNGWVIASDTLPVNATYGAPTVGNFAAVNNPGNIACDITTGVLSCSANGGDVTIDPGGSFTVSFATTPTAIGSLQNIAAAVDPEEHVIETDENDNSGSNTVAVAGSPFVTLEKIGTLDMTVVGPADTANAGDVINYAFTVTNSGDVPLTNIIVSDPLISVAGGPLASLAAGAADSTTFTGTYTLTQADIDAGTFTNIATVTATPPFQPDVTGTGVDTQSFSAAPALIVLKTETSTGPYTVGGTISYAIVVTNTGNVTLHNVAVTDNAAVLGTCTPAQPGELAPAAQMMCSASHQVTQADVDAGSYTNTASADADETMPQTSTVTVTFPPNPGLTVAKTESSTGPYVVGDTINYSIVVTNTGNVTLHNVSITDSSATLETCIPAQPTDLAPTAQITCSASHQVTQMDVDAGSYVNTATADSNETTPQTSTVTVTFPPNPALTVGKTESSTGPYVVGDIITYSIVVTNTGNITLHNVTVADNAATLGACTPAQPAVLNPLAVMTCTAGYALTQADVDAGSFINMATADSNETTPQTSTVTITFPPKPAMTVFKAETSTGPYTAGDTITYSIVATNTGNITLHNVTVTDNAATLGACTPAQPSTLAPLGSITCSASHQVTQPEVDSGSYTNTASGVSSETTPQTSTVTVTFPPNPELTVLKSESSTGPYGVGSTITYAIVVTNSGNVTLHNVTVFDNAATLGACTPAQPAALAPAAQMTCPASHQVIQSDVDAGSFVNTATADSNETMPHTSTVTIDLPASPGISLVKTGTLDLTSVAPVTLPNPGDVITYAFTVSNTGNVTLTNITLSDTVGGVAISGGPLASLAPGTNDSVTFTAIYTLTQQDINAGSFTNTATANGATPSGGTVTGTDDDTQTLQQAPAMAITKTVTSSGPYTSGSTIHYTIVVTNTGNIPLTNVSVTDAGVGVILGTCAPAQPAVLTPGAVITCSASHLVTQADINAGFYTNTATADSDQTAPVSDDATVNIPAAPAITLQKTGTLHLNIIAPEDIPNAGDTITYTFTVRNTGNVTLTNISLADTVGGVIISGGPIATLEPGANDSATFTGLYTLQQGDIDLGTFTNIATVTGMPPAGNPVTSTDDDSQELQGTPVLGLAKRVVNPPVEVSPGVWDVRYEILVRNYGNLPILSLQVTDDLAATFPLPTTFNVQSRASTSFATNGAYNGSTDTNLLSGTDRLEVGETGTINLVVRVTPASAGPFNNSASGTGITSTEVPVTDGSQNDGEPDPDGDGDPTNNNDPTPVDFGARIFDPPLGIKTVNADGQPNLRWTVVWINNSNLVGIAALASDSIPAGATYLAVGAPSGYPVPSGAPAASTNLGVSCKADLSSTVTATTLCYYEGPTSGYPRGRIIWQGTLGPDLGATNASNADDEIAITFAVRVNTGVTSIVNTATIDSDLNGDGDTSDSGEVQVASASEDWALTINNKDVEELPATGFAPGRVTVLPAQPTSRAYSTDGDLILEIPSLGVKIPIVGVPFEGGGWDSTWLGSSAGWLGGTAFPSWKGNSVITGHVYNQTGLPGPFVNLSKLKWGDRIIIHAYGETHVYEVRMSRLIKPDDTSVLEHKEQPWITLLTCKEYNEKKGAYLWRVAVQAVLIKVEEGK